MTNVQSRGSQANHACTLHQSGTKPSMEGTRMAPSQRTGERVSGYVLGLAGKTHSIHAAEIIRRTAQSWEVTWT